MLALMLWTICMLALVALRRFRAAFAGRLKIFDLSYGESENVPAGVRLPNRIFMNLTEVPMLFCALCLMGFISQQVDSIFLAFAWTFVVLRVAHSVIYLSWNHLKERFTVFALSSSMVLGMILLLAVHIV